MANLIGRVVFQPAAPKPGESVRVEVLGGDGQPIAANIDLRINGIPGAVQYLQFAHPGERRIAVRAIGPDGKTERRVEKLNVVQGMALLFKSANAVADLPMLNVSQKPTNAYQAMLTLGSFIDTRSAPILSTDGAASPAVEPQQPVAARGALERALREKGRPAVPRAKTKASAARSSRGGTATVFALGDLDVRKALEAQATEPEAQYEWDFGDGHTATTNSPSANHDYFRSIDHAKGHGQFVVTCHAAHSGTTVKRTLTIQSAYAMCKRTGTISAHVTADVFAHKRYAMISGAFTVDNVEDQPIVLDRVSLTAHTDEGETVSVPRPFVKLERAITIPAKSSSAVGVNVPFVVDAPKDGELRFDARAFTALYAGTCGRLQVRCSAVFEVPASEWDIRPERPQLRAAPSLAREPWPWDEVEGFIERMQPKDVGPVTLDRGTGTIAVTLGPLHSDQLKKARKGAQRVLAAIHAPMDARALELRRLVPVSRTLAANALRLSGQSPGLAAPALAQPEPGPIAEGEICDPDNLTEQDQSQADAGQLVCQLTDEVIDVPMPARWMNARKGDVILSPGGDGIIGGLMLNVNPPQWYSHCGIMTRNYDEITHSTGSQERLLDHLRGDGADGFEPKALKYLWPGAVTQTVEHSMDGEPFPDPERPEKTYMVSSFDPHTVGVTHNDRMVMIPPLVLKPDPTQETAEVRAALHAIASDARASAGRPGVKSKYHYRWYCYTKPEIGSGPAAGAEAGWAQGTRPTVCSSFVWLHAKARGAKLESDAEFVAQADLEPDDVAKGARVRPTTRDGLYTYGKTERLHAGEWLYDTIYNMAYDKAGWLGNILTNAADDLANQFLNAFENDDDDGTDSEAWRQTKDANAVSPDDMLWWDGPANGGLYGYAEPALYREPRIERYQVSRWKKVLTRGTLHGRVLTDQGAACAGALVQAYEGKSVFSAGDGSYTLADVPLGPYLLKASKVIDGVLQSAEVPVDLTGAELVTDIGLKLPQEQYRLAQVVVDFWGRDKENFGPDEIYNPGPEYLELDLGPDKRVSTSARTYRWGGELRTEYTITLRLVANNAIEVAVKGKLFEGTSEDTTDLDGQGAVTFQVPAGQTVGATLTIKNTAESDDDAGVLSISVKNVRNTN